MLSSVAASAKVVKVPTGVGAEEVTVGLQPHSLTLRDGTSSESKQFANATGGPVVPANKTYAIYWDPTYNYHNDWEEVIDTFFHNLGAGSGSLASVYAVDAQYTDAANQHADYNSTFQGAYTDTDSYPTSGNCVDPHPLVGDNYPWGAPDQITCLTSAQLEAELKTFIANHKLVTGMSTIFYLLTPPGVTVCLDKGGPEGHCSDFNGTLPEIANYEESKATYSERLVKYNKEYAQYQKESIPYEKAKALYEAEVEKYELEKEKDEKEGVPDTEAEPVAPVKPTEPVHPKVLSEPVGYDDYQKSFCSYHADINPGGLANGGPNTVLYSVIPWIAGGLGDYHINDFVSGYDCQDGGFDPSTKPIEEKEKIEERTVKEEEEFAEKDSEEKIEQEEAELLAGPRQQEPNQVACPTPDGYCDTGLADPIISQIGAEQQNIVTDPLLSSWRDPSGDEVTDECRDFFQTGELSGSSAANPETFAGTLFNQTLGGGSYYINDAFNLAALKLNYPGVPCRGEVNLDPKFTAPSPVNSGEVVGFNGMESELTLNWGTLYEGGKPKPTYATYTWNFGDGSPLVSGFAPGAPTTGNSPAISPCGAEPWEPPCAASEFHSYEYGGTYNVTLTIKDTAGNEASYTEAITVDGPPAPSPEKSGPGTDSGPNTGSSGPGSVSAATTTTNTTTTGSTATGSSTPVPVPVIGERIVSTSLASVLRSGLGVSYSVNEQVAGHFDVILNASVAKRLGIKGSSASGLPAGTPKSIVIAQAILVTTKGGHSTIKIKFSKRTATDLRKTKKVSLMLRLSVRNAAVQHPATATALVNGTLH